MRLYTIEIEQGEVVALQHQNGKLYPISEFGMMFANMNKLIDAISEEQMEHLKEIMKSEDAIADVQSYEIGQCKICAPIPVPKQDIVCLGVNYEEHIEETKDIIDFREKKATVYFSKRVNEAGGQDAGIPNYDFVDSLDYEVELGVILGKDAKGVSLEETNDIIFGYTIINDVSARNLQLRHQQWYVGKSLDGYTLMGPCIVTADELTDVQNLEISCKINGELRQSSNTKYMIQDVANAICEITQGITLKKGTIIATGTPGGVGMGMNPPRFLQAGDEVVCEIEGIGILRNTVETKR